MLLPFMPRVIGEVPAALLDSLPDGEFSNLHRLSGITCEEPHAAALELGKIVATMLDRSFNDDSDMYAYHCGRVKPDTSLRSNEWHRDSNTCIVANHSPTEFLITQTFLESEDLNDASDEQLIQNGYAIWQPEPYQVVLKPDVTIHRSPVNHTVDTYQRTMFALSIV